MSNEELWQTVLAQIQFSVSRANFATWFSGTKITNSSNGEITVAVPNLFAKEWLENKYQSLILKIFRSLEPNIRTVEFIIKLPAPNIQKSVDLNREEERALSLETQLQFPEFQVDQKTNLNPRYNFNNFIVGGFNELAHAAALAVSEKPGLVYNPLFIYGGVGLGKTHLLQATGSAIFKLFPDKKVKYTSSERFISKIVDAIRNQEIEELKKRLGKLDVLINSLLEKKKPKKNFFIFLILSINNKNKLFFPLIGHPTLSQPLKKG
jgi:chromosomal replication initiator protein